MAEIRKIECPKDRISVKCPFAMNPTRIVIHNTANDAAAQNEITYMHRNSNQASFHFAVDDTEIVQGIPLTRNAWHAGDGNGKGNREGIAIEICYSKSGGERWMKAVKNAAELTAKLLKDYGWGIDRVTKHEDYTGKHCPHRILDEYGWGEFIDLVANCMTDAKPKETAGPIKKSVEEIAKEVLSGIWGNGAERKARLTEAGYDYNAVQKVVNQLCGKTASAQTAPKKKSNEEIAKEVIAGKWGNGSARKTKLKNAGYDYAAIQKIVNKMLKG